MLKLAELGSLQRTAQAIGMTQSSVTQTLAYLEQLLETRLFERHARGVRPTSACEDLLPVAKQLLFGIEQGAEVVAARQHRGRGTVRVVASVGAMNGLLVDSLPRFGELHPKITIHLVEGEGDDQLLSISRGEVDLVVCRRPQVIPEGWRFEHLRDDRFAVLGWINHPLAARKALRWQALADETWLITPTGSAARARFDELTAEFPHSANIYPVVTRSPAMLWRVLRTEKVLTLLPINFARPLIEAREVCELDVRPLNLLEPLGVLRPLTESSEATELLRAYLGDASAVHEQAGSHSRKNSRRAP
ncbi:hypothetical protein ASE39_04295 [Acidovorax sp. Root267]|nr:hypothetical protein ASE39_04295 [Acidovorax sp. Root267]